MKKFLVLMFLLAMPFCLFGCLKEEEKLNFYQIDAVFDEAENTLSCSQSVSYVNNSDNALTTVSFFLYANSFNEGQKAVSTAYKTKAYPNGESFGKIEFSSVKIGENETEYDLEKPNNNILNVNLGKNLFPKDSIEINLEYTIDLANVNHRLGYGENAINFGNFFPIACVYENGFYKNEFSTNGDPFYSDTSNFEVNIKCDKDFVVACTGDKTEKIENEYKIVSAKAIKVRDFCFVLSEKFEKLQEKVGEVDVCYYFYDDEDAKHHLQTAVDALITFEKLFGKYPFKQLSVVKTNFCFGGMEYPNLVMISDDLADSQTFDYVIVHEIAHQWWYSLVGNNQCESAWLDESITEYSTFLFYENNPDYNVNYEVMLDNAKESYKSFVRVYTDIVGKVDQSMNRALNDFATEPEYVHCVYTKGVLMYDSLRAVLGERKFFKCLKNYFDEYKYKNSSPEKLIESFSKSAHMNLEGFFKSWLEGKVVIN